MYQGKIALLEKQKKEAINEEKYLEANKIKEEIETLKKKCEEDVQKILNPEAFKPEVVLQRRVTARFNSKLHLFPPSFKFY
jgi:hypothetical protein